MTFFSKDNVKHFEVPGDDGKIDTLALLEAARGVVEMVCKYFISFVRFAAHVYRCFITWSRHVAWSAVLFLSYPVTALYRPLYVYCMFIPSSKSLLKRKELRNFLSDKMIVIAD